MPRDNQGIYTRQAGVLVGSTIYQQEFNSNTDISFESQDADHNDMADALTDSWSRSGKGPATANLNLNNFKFIGAAAATANGEFVRFQEAARLAQFDWIVHTPVLTANNGGIISALTVLISRYIKVGKFVVFECSLRFTLTGAGVTTLSVTSPVDRDATPTTSRSYGSVVLFETNFIPGFYNFITNQVNCLRNDTGVISAGTNREVSFTVAYASVT